MDHRAAHTHNAPTTHEAGRAMPGVFGRPMGMLWDFLGSSWRYFGAFRVSGLNMPAGCKRCHECARSLLLGAFSSSRYWINNTGGHRELLSRCPQICACCARGSRLSAHPRGIPIPDTCRPCALKHRGTRTQNEHASAGDVHGGARVQDEQAPEMSGAARGYRMSKLRRCPRRHEGTG